MSVASVDFVREDFIELVEKQIKSQRSGKCTSIAEIEELRKEAVKKRFRSKHDSRDTNLLFPPTVIRTFLSKERVESVLGCKCAVCKRFLDDNADTVNSSLVKKLTQTNGDDARRLFSVLLFMGAGFTARHLCGIHFTGLDITPQEAELRVLFSRVQARGLWPDEGDLASRFIAIFKEARSIFEVPTFELGNHDTLTTDTFRSHENLPFLNEKPLGDPARAPLWSFEIHEEFRGKSIPIRLVRKELPKGKVNPDEKRVFEALKLLDTPRRRHFVNLEFSYSYHEQENYVFREYASSLQDILNGKELPEKPPSPQRYRGSILQHWLWQGAMDVVDAMAFFHSPEFFIQLSQSPLTAAHFDLKPANLLIDNDGSLVLTDFGDVRIVCKGERFETSGGDYNYGPPGSRKSVTWSQAYDVWSMACVLTEIIEYIYQINGCDAVAKFRKNRRADYRDSDNAFWIPRDGGRSFELRPSVKKILGAFKIAEDPYLKEVTDLLERMFAVRESERPSMAQCSQRFAIIFQNVTMDPYLTQYEGEIPISDLGTKNPLRNMLTHFKHETENSEGRQKCKMYMSLDERKGRVRLVLLTEKKGPDKGKPVPSQLDSSALCKEEGLKLLSLFKGGPPHELAFIVMHCNLKFFFDVSADYYHFLAAVTHQEVYRKHDKKTAAEVAGLVNMPIKGCIIKYSGDFWKNNRAISRGGHVQIWRELSDDEYNGIFTLSITALNLEDRRESVSSKSSRLPSRTATGLTTQSNMLGISSARKQISPSSKITLPRRVVIFLPGTAPATSRRYLTINIANGISDLEPGLNSEKTKSNVHFTMRKRSSKGDFLIGKIEFETESGSPAIPLDPRFLRAKETVKVEWVELEFADESVSRDFETLCADCLSARSISRL